MVLYKFNGGGFAHLHIFKGKAMKKLLLVFVLMTSVCFASDVHIVKDTFTPNIWTAYIPADNVGEYYTAIKFGTPKGDDLYLPNITIFGMVYGKLRPAYSASAYDNPTESTLSTTGTWTEVASQGDGDWYIAFGSTTDAEMIYNVPENHNEIHITIRRLSGGADTDIEYDWSDGTTDGLLQLNNAGTSQGVQDIVLCTTATGAKSLRATSKLNAGNSQIIGFRSYNTNEVGDLSASDTDSLVYLTTRFGSTYGLGAIGTLGIDDATVVNMSDIVNPARAYEFAVKWDVQGGGVPNWTGGNTHYGDLPYVLGATFSAEGPELIVDGVSKSFVFDNTTNPRGTHYSGSRIFIQSDGTINHGTTDPTMSWIYNIEPTGMEVVGSITWGEAVEFESPNISAYTPMMVIGADLAVATNNFVFEDGTETAISESGNQTFTGKGNACSVIDTNRKLSITLTSFSPISKWLFVEADDKFYGQITDSIPGQPNPAAGQSLLLGGRWSVYRTDSQGNPLWKNIRYGNGYRSRYAYK